MCVRVPSDERARCSHELLFSTQGVLLEQWGLRPGCRTSRIVRNEKSRAE